MTLRQLARVIDKLVSSFPAVQFGPLHYRILEVAKTKDLQNSKGNFDSMTTLSGAMKQELSWWIDKIVSSSCPISYPNPDLSINTDASLLGWGAVCNNSKAQGKFLPQEIQNNGGNINALELLAIKYGLQYFKNLIQGKYILVKCDNTTAVSYIRNMGGTHSYICNEIAKDIWFWCKSKNVWLSITYVPGKSNTSVDFQSRNFSNDHIECMGTSPKCIQINYRHPWEPLY